LSERLKFNLRRSGSGVSLTVRLTPKAGIETFGVEAVLTARVRAFPEAGRANEPLDKLISTWLDVPRLSVRVVHGGKSRLKRVAIEGDPDALVAAIAPRLDELERDS
jgi:uncharacterized protein